MKRIGLVLANSPGYSETFFCNKIKVLHDSGFEVFLFSDRIVVPVSNVRQVAGFGLPSSLLIRIIKVFFVIVSHLIIWPKRTHRFISLERKEGRSFLALVRNLYRCIHILRYKLDWLHFGFATLAVGRENVAGACGAKMGISFRGYDVSIYPLKHPGCYTEVWKKVDKVHTISDDLYQVALSLGLSPSIPMIKITPAIDVSVFSLDIPSAIDALPGKPIQIITTSRLHWKKGLDIALLALRQLKQQGIDFHFTIVGEGEEYEKLIYLRHILNLDDSVEFVGKKSHADVVQLLKQSYIYIQPSIQEGFCNSVLEAQAIGLLCIVSDAEGLSENVVNNVTGWVVPKLDPLLLRKKIEEVLAMPENDKNAIRKAASERVHTHFNLQNHATLFPQFFN